jgi:hypothetical protein
MGIWREDLISINGFNEEFEGWGLEDSDLGNRLYHLGRARKLVYGRAIIHHLNHGQLPRNRLSENQSRLRLVLDQKVVECTQGLRNHLDSEA